MNNMKKYIFAAATIMMLGAASAFAQDDNERQLDSEGKENYFYVDGDCIVYSSQNNQGVLRIHMDNETPDLNSMMFDIYLPEGFSIAKNSRGSYMATYNNGDDNKTYNHSARVTDNGDFFRIIGFSITGDPILTGDDLLLTITIQAPDTYTNGSPSYKGSIKNIEIASQSNTVNPHYFPDVTFTIMTEQIANGIDDVMIGTEGLYPEGIYDLYGRKLNPDKALTPGVYIIDGEKVLVK